MPSAGDDRIGSGASHMQRRGSEARDPLSEVVSATPGIGRTQLHSAHAGEHPGSPGQPPHFSSQAPAAPVGMAAPAGVPERRSMAVATSPSRANAARGEARFGRTLR